jgi:hypothetical protein
MVLRFVCMTQISSKRFKYSEGTHAAAELPFTSFPAIYPLDITSKNFTIQVFASKSR